MNVAEDELSRVFRQHYRELVVLARWFVDRSDLAEELVQEAFARTIASWSRVRRRDDPLPYVRRTLVNLSNSALRRRAVARRLPVEEQRRGASAEVELFEVERRYEVGAAVRALPRRQRECVVLRFGFEYSIAQIAADLHISDGAVKRHLHRALATLRDELDEEVFEETCQ